MSGYKRVNFYELCRLCATNQQKDHKTHIFQEEGRKIQLQTKIQSCLSLTVCENDFLPKVVCSKCLRSLEVCYTFRQECVTSETMLSSYFKNFRYTEDFKKSGKVYIKDTNSSALAAKNAETLPAPLPPPPPLLGYNSEALKASDVPFYAVQLPTIVTNQQIESNKVKSDQKVVHNNSYQNSLPTNNNSTLKIPQKNNGLSDNLSNVVVNANGEVLNIAQLVDFDHLINNTPNVVAAPPTKKKKKRDEIDNLIKIDLATNSEDQMEKSKKFAAPPTTYAIKVEDAKLAPSVIFNNLDFNSAQNFNYYNNQNGQNILPSGGSVETSTVNLNQLNSDLFQTQHATQQRANNFLKDQEGVKMHTCEICQKSFKRREHLYQHVKLHTGFRPYTCESCNKSFMRKEHLLRHMTSHSGQKNFTCNICDKSFSRNDNLLKHKKTHDKQTSYQCDVCRKHFVMKHYYLAHKLTHDGGGAAGSGGSAADGTSSGGNSNNNNIGNVWNVLKA